MLYRPKEVSHALQCLLHHCIIFPQFSNMILQYLNVPFLLLFYLVKLTKCRLSSLLQTLPFVLDRLHCASDEYKLCAPLHVDFLQIVNSLNEMLFDA